MPGTICWAGTLTALSSVAHGGDTRGTITLLRRELIVQPDGRAVHVPVISGNALRGRLRRIGEELLRDTLHYEGQLPLGVAHALRGGGALVKTSGSPLSGARLHQLRALVPHVGVFGCAGGGRIIDGALQVGKVLPHLAETAHILNPDSAGPIGSAGSAVRLPSAFSATQVETYVRSDDSTTHAFPRLDLGPPPRPDGAPTEAPDLPVGPAAGGVDPSMLLTYRVETFPAGTRFATWLRLDRATDLEIAYFTDVLRAFTAGGRLGGRTAIGHGRVRAELSATVLAGTASDADWRAYLLEHRDTALAALQALA